MLKVQMFPAKEGDAISIEWGDERKPYQLLIDLGTQRTGRELLERYKARESDQRQIELLVITHIDRDHIGGALTALIDDKDNNTLQIKDTWFNGRMHLEGGRVEPATVESYGIRDGEELTLWLKDKPWNQAFNGEAILFNESELLTHTLADDLTITIIGPPQNRLDKLLDKWPEEVRLAYLEEPPQETPAGFESLGQITESFERGEKPELTDHQSLTALADYRSDKTDKTPANGSSIAFVIDYKGKRLLFTGDAFPEDLIKGLSSYGDESELKFDLVKLPHHGSLKNVSEEFIRSVECQNWLVSTDGTRFKHPDSSAIARIIKHTPDESRPHIIFNVKSQYNEWWGDESWQDNFQYTTEFGDDDEGVIVEFE